MSNQPAKKTAGYYIRFRGQTTGPHNLAQVREGIASGSISRLHDVSRDQTHWHPIHTRPAILLSDASPEQAHSAPETSGSEQVKTAYVTPHDQPAQSTDETKPAAPSRSNYNASSKDNLLPELDAEGNEDIIEKILKEPRPQ